MLSSYEHVMRSLTERPREPSKVRENESSEVLTSETWGSICSSLLEHSWEEAGTQSLWFCLSRGSRVILYHLRGLLCYWPWNAPWETIRMVISDYIQI